MDNAYGAPKTGHGTDISEFGKRPRTWNRAALFLAHLVTLSTQASQSHDSGDQCLFFDQSRCDLQMAVSIFGFFGTVGFALLDFFFVEISSASKRKKVCLAELVSDAALLFFTFVSFCSIAAGWAKFDVESEMVLLFSSSARAILAFSFLAIPLWAVEFAFCLKNYRQGYYYLYERVEQGVLSAFAPVISDISDSAPNPYDSISEPGMNWDQNEFQPTPFSAEFRVQTGQTKPVY